MNSKNSIDNIITAYLEGDLHGEKLEQLTQWIGASAENARYYSTVKDIWEASLADVSAIAETEKEWGRFLFNVKRNYQSNVFWHNMDIQNIYRFAAILIVGIVIGSLVHKYKFMQEPIFISSFVPNGSISQMVLADSTIVYLNAGSEIRYSPESKNRTREVYLNGEAWFHVAKNTKKPFVVHTALFDVNVTGTKFNVKSYNTDKVITTTLEEGEVIISSSEEFKLAENIKLNPGEQIVYNKELNNVVLKKVDTDRFTSWKNNKLVFLNLSFEELIILFERRYGVDIEVENPEILKLHYTGTIKNESILEILEILKHTLPIQYKIEGQKIIISNN